MNVYVVILEVIAADALLFGVRPRVRQRGLRGFLHHFAELPGEHELPFAFDGNGFDEEDVAAH